MASNFTDSVFEPTSNSEWKKVTMNRKRQKVSSAEMDIVDIDNYMSFSIDQKLQLIYTDLRQSKTEMSNISEKLDFCLQINDKVQNLEQHVNNVDARVLLLEYKSIDLEARSRRKNLIFSGFSEARDEDCAQKLQHFIKEKLKVTSTICIDRAHRLGRYSRGKERGIIAAFRDHTDTELILSSAHHLAGSSYSINRDFPPEITNARRQLWSEYKTLKRDNPDKKVGLVYPCKILMNGRVVRDAFPLWDRIMQGSRIAKVDNQACTPRDTPPQNVFDKNVPTPKQIMVPQLQRSSSTSSENSGTTSQTARSHKRQSRSPRRRRHRSSRRIHAPSRPNDRHQTTPPIRRPWDTGGSSGARQDKVDK